MIEVQDTGKGMTEHQQENIFDEFGELLLDGIGLGLSICKKITEGMGGKISFKSQEGIGTTFRVSIEVRNWREGQPINKSKSSKSLENESNDDDVQNFEGVSFGDLLD